MKFPIISTVAVTACALTSIAQAEIKVAAVNVQELYRSYYKRVDAEKMLKEHEAKIMKEITERAEKLKALAEELQRLKQKADPALSESARKKIQEDYSAKFNKAQAAEQEFKSFQKRRQVALQEVRKREIVNLLMEIQTLVKDAAAKGNYDLVIDKGAVAPPLGTQIFPFVKDSFDITPEMIKALNKDAPEGYDPQAELNRTNGTMQ